MCMHFSADDAAVAFGATFAATAAIATALGGFVYWRAEKRGRARWWEVPDGEIPTHTHAGPFRSAGTVPRYLSRAPVSIRCAGFAAIALGLCAVPLVALAVILLSIGAAVGALLFVPGIVAGAKLFAAGRALLARAFCAHTDVMSAAQWTTVLSSTYLGLVGVISVAAPDRAMLLGLSLSVPALVSLVVAHALRRAVSRHQAALDFEG